MRIALSFADSADYSTYDRNLNLGQDDNGEEIDLEITITKDQLIDAIGEQYQKAVNICKNLLERNGLTGKDLSSLILVGGPTYSPIIRDMLKKEVTQNVDTSINPMTAVARGAALYASTIDANINEAEIKKEAKADIVFLQLVMNPHLSNHQNGSASASIRKRQETIAQASCLSNYNVQMVHGEVTELL